MLLLVAYGIYVRRTMKSEGDLEGESRALYFHRTAESPELRRVILQIIVALAAIIFGADLFVGELTTISAAAGVPTLVISLLITPVATELPEKFNSVMWMRQKKDTLALGNITGRHGLPEHVPGGHRHGVHRVAAVRRRRVARGRGGRLALFSGALLYGRLRFTKGGFGVGSLLFGGVLYAAFLVVHPLVGPREAPRRCRVSAVGSAPAHSPRARVGHARRPPPRRPSTHCSRASATPSRRFDDVITSAAALAAGVALPMATPMPAHCSRAASLSWSPMAMICSAGICICRASCWAMAALEASMEVKSRMPGRFS